MHTEPTREHLIRYLLGHLRQADAEALEEAFFVDDELFSRLTTAQDDLIDAYVTGDLPEADRTRLDARLLATDTGDQQLAFARALSERLAADERSAPSGASAARLFGWRWPASPAGLSIAGALAIALLVVGVVTTSRPALVTLQPDHLRGPAAVQHIEVGWRGQPLELYIDPAEAATVFQVELTRGEQPVWRTVVRIDRDDVPLVVVPSSVLTQGPYRLDLHDDERPVESYAFTVR